MLKRQTSGSVVCPSCRKLVGVNDEKCFHCGRRNPGMWGFGRALQQFGLRFSPTQLILGGTVALYVVSLLLDPRSIGGGGPMSILSPSGASLVALGGSGSGPVMVSGRWWTVLSAGWLHGGLIHILFNMMWLRQLAPLNEEIYKANRTVIIYIGSSAAGFLLSAVGGFFGGPLNLLMGGSPRALSVGASAAIFGLLGALVYAGRRGVASHIGRRAWVWAIILFLFGLVFPQVDNWAHLGGYLGGYGLGRALDPYREEKLDDLVAALFLLAASVGAVIYTFVRFLPLLSNLR